MPDPKALFWDVGGVLLTNGWDRASRRKAVETFGLEGDEFESRHELVNGAFESGKLALDDYLDRTVFYQSQVFSREAFKEFMFGQSAPYPEALLIAEQLSGVRRYLMATLNNESLELNLYRIDRFALRRYFAVFFSSCFLGVRKPDEAIFRLALQVTQLAPHESVFIDDRAVNLECAHRIGMRTIHYQNAVQLQDELRALRIDV
ncbi:MAG: HAD family hydrolase [Armatimonadota bacterium]